MRRFNVSITLFVTFESSLLVCRLISSLTVEARDRSVTRFTDVTSRSMFSSTTEHSETGIYHLMSNVYFS